MFIKCDITDFNEKLKKHAGYRIKRYKIGESQVSHYYHNNSMIARKVWRPKIGADTYEIVTLDWR